MMRRLMAVLAFSAAVASGHAQSVLDSGQCPGVQPYGDPQPITLMKVVASEPRVPFIESRSAQKAQCPSTAPACQRKAFLVAGDEVLALPARNGLTCTTFISPDAKARKGQFPETNGYLPAASLAAVRLEPVSSASWAGKWSRSAEAEIEITVGRGGKLKVAGSATFGALDPGRVKRGAVNMGELEGEATPKGDMLALGDGYDGKAPLFDDKSGECKARLRLFGRYLVVEDNLSCGGMNVSFSGVYVRLKAP